MKNLKRLGYVSIELVITAAIILAVGFFSVMSMGETGSLIMQNAMNRLDDLYVFDNQGGGIGGEVNPPGDENGYPIGTDPGDIAALEEFNFVWDETYNGWAITEYYNCIDGQIKNLVLPYKRDDGLPIVSVGDYSLNSCELESLIIPNSYKYLGQFAISNNRLTEINIPESVVALGEEVFGTNQLTSVKIPSLVKGIPMRAFNENNLVSVDLNKVESIDEAAFYSNKLTEVAFPETLGYINNYAFAENEIESLAFSNTKIVMGDYVFSDNKINSFVFPSWMDTVSEGTFNANILTSLDVPKHVTNIGARAFQSNLIESISLPDDYPTIGTAAFNNNAIVDGPVLFYEDSSFTKITSFGGLGGYYVYIEVPEGVLSIGSYAFHDSDIWHISLPSTLVRLESAALSSNGGLNSLNIPQSVNYIGNRALSMNHNLTSIKFYGARPTVGEQIVSGNPAYNNYIKVPNAYLTDYRNNASEFGLTSSKFSGY